MRFKEMLRHLPLLAKQSVLPVMYAKIPGPQANVMKLSGNGFVKILRNFETDDTKRKPIEHRDIIPVIFPGK